MAADIANSNNTYEEARKLRLEENKRRFEDLGISKLSKSLSTPEKKTKQRLPKPKSETPEVLEPRRSTRTRNAVTSYNDDVGVDLPPLRKRYKSSSSSWDSYIVRPLDEVKLASYEDRTRALRAAEEFQTSLQSEHPSFVKSMVRSHVYSCFWLGLPTQFCRKHLPKKDLDMILEDENGSTYDAKYLGGRTGLSGGWRGFALDHKLDDGDAVVFELVEPDKFKVYTIRISSLVSAQTDIVNTVDKEELTAKNTAKGRKKAAPDSGKTQKSKKAKPKKNDVLSDTETSQPENEITSEEISEEKIDSTRKNGFFSEEDVKSINLIEKNGFIPEEDVKSIDSIEKNGFFPEEDVETIDSIEKNGSVAEEDDKKIDPIEENDFVPQKDDKNIVWIEENGFVPEDSKKCESVNNKKKKQENRVLKPRKKPAPRFFRRK